MIYHLLDIACNLTTHRLIYSHVSPFLRKGLAPGWAFLLNLIAFILLNIGIIDGFLHIISNNPGAADKLILSGFALQSFALLHVFVFLTAVCIQARHFLFRWRPYERQEHVEQNQQNQQELSQEEQRVAKRVRRFTLVIWLSFILLLLRTLFRLAETALASNGKTRVIRNEIYFGLFEFGPVVVTVWLLGVWDFLRVFIPGTDWRGAEE